MKLTNSICCYLQEIPYPSNIFKQLDGPCIVPKRLKDYSPEEVASFPIIVDGPMLEVKHD